ncbi:MAG: 4-carboxymuconolactone decarboxylase [Gammaproteobacteria bacterium]|jgi:4-carboxymuconolactone decarboxylase
MAETPNQERGMALRREVLGDEHVDRSLERAAGDAFLQPVQDLATEFGWGAVWARPGLEKKTRSFLSMTCLAAFGRHDELRTHIRGAVRNGATREEIREVILHVGVYCGLPVALESTRIAKEVLDEMDA